MNTRAIKELVRHYHLGISPRRLGQNFLVDPRALARIVATIGATAQDRVLEIGAGLGALTEELLTTGAVVHAVEKDAGFLRVLTDRFKESDRLQLVRSDVLRLDLGSIAVGEPKSLLVVGNVPFSMTSPILEFLLKERPWVKRVVLTVQKEVAQRIVARPGTKQYSSITLLVQVAFRPVIAFTIPPNAFYPQPKVTSAVLRLEPLAQPPLPPEEEERALKLVRLLFVHRRKTLLNCLVFGGINLGKEEILQRLRRCKVDPARRPETFSLAEMAELSRVFHPPR